MSKKYGFMYEEDLNDWEQLPLNLNILTSPQMSCWLLRRDENKAKKEKSNIESLIDKYTKMWHELDDQIPFSNNPSAIIAKIDVYKSIISDLERYR